ncbi:unnamed protein product [Didymodactylos carnosus]|uniref:Reverse transcriptase domain-containing protein n=2 Tax=Didymodactylos carnosus TaxID=1234261 RepID=A0A815N215_9BILA|nr:unnamed protein product [Didymodactylos carnosus]CAF4309503.1 unnamed protein product [Didymodactylos carnosus]
MSTRRYPSIGFTYYLLMRLKNFLQSETRKKHSIVKRLKQLLLTKFLYYFETDHEQLNLLKMHSYLDPAGFSVLSDKDKRSIEQDMKTMVADDISRTTRSTPRSSLSDSTVATTPTLVNKSKRSAMDAFHESIGDYIHEGNVSDISQRATIIDEVRNYRQTVTKFNLKHKPDELSATVFWGKYNHCFPLLGKLAKKLLSTPATSVPSESAFSLSAFLGRKELEKIEVLPELCCICDHNVVKFSINIAQLPVTQYSRKIYDYRRANWDVFRDKLAELDWYELVEDGGLDNSVLLVEKMILWIADFVVPHKIIVVKSNDRPWFNENLRELLKKKYELYKIDCRFKTTSSAANSRRASHDFEKACKAAKKEYYLKLSAEMNSSSKLWWRQVKNTLNKINNISIPPLFDSSSKELMIDPGKKAEPLNKYFAMVCSMPLNEVNDVPLVVPTSSKFSMTKFHIFESVGLLCRIDCSRASAPGLSARIVREAAPVITPMITYLFNQSLEQEQFSKTWKLGYITSIFKSGDPHEVNNYRPITLLPVLSKILERLIHRKVYGYLTNYNLLSTNQSGFRHGDSTINQLIAIVHEILLAFDNSERVLSVFLDFRKAFDTVWHKGLLVKLKAKGLPPSLVNWFGSYLSNREIVTTVDGITSSARIVDRRVPQGSVLRPLLFLIFIDNLGDNVSATMRLFADDASLYRVTEKNDIRKVIDQVNKDLLLIYEWSITWKLYLNIDKCKAMIFSIRERDTLASLPPVLINKSPISYVVEQKQLGLILRSNLD